MSAPTAEEALAEAQESYPAFTIPEPLRRCQRCGEHAALYQDSRDRENEFICGPCGPSVTLFVLPIRATDPRQQAADAALREAEAA